MDYGRIVSRSFEIAWEHKWLWIFGMFAAATGYNIKLEYIFGASPSNPFAAPNMEAFDPSALIGSYLGFIPLIFIISLMVFFATGAIIDSVNRIERGGSYSFSTAFSAGSDFFLRFLGMGIIFFVAMMAYFFIVAIIIATLFAINTALGFLALFFAFFISLCIGIIVSQISNNAYRVIVLRNSGILDAISEGVQLVKLHFGKNVAAFFIMFAFAIAFAIFSFIFWLFLNYPIDYVVQTLHLKSYPAMLAALILGMPFTYLTAGFMGVFSTTFFTLFYIELVDPKPESAYFPQPPEVNLDQ